MLSKSLTKVFDLGAWELDLAAWIFTGYSPLNLEETGHIIRLVDDEEIPHGTTEFREAKKEQGEILFLLQGRIGEAQGFIFTPNDDGENVDIWTPNHHFERNWLINQVVNGFSPEEKINPWWLDRLIFRHWLPAYINPDAISPTWLERWGYNSFVYPRDPEKEINPPEVFDALDEDIHKELLEGTYRRRDGKRLGAPPALYQPSGVKPHPSNYFYLWLYDKIDSMTHDVPDELYEGHDPIKGWIRHCMPRPTGSVARDIALSEEGKDKFKTTTTNDGTLKYTNPIGYGEADEPILLPGGESKKIKRKSLGDRVEAWFDLTEAGHQYQAYIKSKKS